MRAFDSPTLAALDGPTIIRRGMILFDFPSGLYGFWDGDGPLTYNSVTFKPGGQLIEIDTGTQNLSLDSNGITVKLYANPDVGLTPNILQTIEAESYTQRPVTIYKAIFDADTRALISVNTVWRGYVDQVTHERSADSYAIVGKLESRSLDYTKRGWASASNAQQQQIQAGDRGLEFCGIVETVEVAFGREQTNKLAVTRIRRPVL